MGFSSLNQRYDIIICVYWFELFSQVSDVAHGPLVYFLHDPCTCSFSFSCFPVVDLFSYTRDFIDDVNILNILIGVDSSSQRLNKARMDDVLLSFLNALLYCRNGKCV